MAPRLATLSLSGIAAFTGLVGLEHILRPDYDPRRRFISEYAVGPYIALDLTWLTWISLALRARITPQG